MDVMYVLWLYLLIGLIWAGAEKLFYGVSTPRLIDDVVAIILAVVLYISFRLWARL